MKRESDGHQPGSPKRQKHGGHDIYHSNSRHQSNSRSERDSYTHPDRLKHVKNHQHVETHKNGVAKEPQSEQPASFSDPIQSLKAMLNAIVDNSVETKPLLGAGYKGAEDLLEALSKLPQNHTPSLNLFRPSNQELQKVPSYYAGQHLRAHPLPPLPSVPPGPLSLAPFIHKSLPGHVRGAASTGLNYETLEFLGDAYLETIATRLIFARYSHVAAGRQAQMREQLVKNETLLGFSKAYGFEQRLQVNGQDVNAEIVTKGNKALGKTLADVFEAYIAAIILSDPENGFERVETWMTELWAPILLEFHGPESKSTVQPDYNPSAKMELQKRIANNTVKLDYVDDKPMRQDKHVTTFFIAVYLTGWGYDRERLGSAEGQNKVEAGNRAAMDAMDRSSGIVEDAERKLAEFRERRRVEKERGRER